MPHPPELENLQDYRCRGDDGDRIKSNSDVPVQVRTECALPFSVSPEQVLVLVQRSWPFEQRASLFQMHPKDMTALAASRSQSHTISQASNSQEESR